MDMQVLDQLEQKYESYVSFTDWLKRLEKIYLRNLKEESFSLPADVVIPNKYYVGMLISCISELRIDGLEYELNHLEAGLKEIAETGDFDDAEEIMGQVHEMIKKYIYKSDTKVSSKDWQMIEKYIEKAGYLAVPVKSGDDISPYRTYFERPIGADGGKKNTIKQIQLKPYRLRFYDGVEVRAELKLCGKCTYYK